MTRADLVDATRTPFGRYGRALGRVRCDDLAALPLIALIKRHPRWIGRHSYDADDDRAHGQDERILVKPYYQSLQFNYRLRKAL